MGGRCLLVFSKPPIPGRVKTRLIGQLSAVAAAELHQALLEDLLEGIAGGSFAVRLALALEPAEPVPPPPVSWLESVERQHGADLGERMHHALAAAAASYGEVAVVGSDLPGLDADRVEEAFAALARGAEVVLGPTADGGYYLLALRADRIDPELFRGVEWSTQRVLEQTLERCHALGLRAELLDPGRDIDAPADLEWLMDRLDTGALRSSRVAAWVQRQHPDRGATAVRRT